LHAGFLALQTDLPNRMRFRCRDKDFFFGIRGLIHS
jgi:hypothetical protein